MDRQGMAFVILGWLANNNHDWRIWSYWYLVAADLNRRSTKINFEHHTYLVR